MMAEENFNQLTPAQTELLALLAEECGEVVQIVGKILRHGLKSHHPKDEDETTNAELLAKEIGDLLIAADAVVAAQMGVTRDNITKAEERKVRSIQQYLHHATIRQTWNR
ncbi:MAG: hypothetical protein C4523_02605 [Myxococcales bacterium]|jgi:NTP pyrophosphatase (non-canonical NTP hydrolase)|nr:MAG: hypothetical protein C4523_02605 [Myxococcales bacterium]